jgi:hypothetical protein
MLAHELHHRWQFMTYGAVLYAIMAMPMIRKFTIERNTYKLQNIVDEMMNDNTGR